MVKLLSSRDNVSYSYCYDRTIKESLEAVLKMCQFKRSWLLALIVWVVRMDCCSANSTDSYGTFPTYVTTFNVSSTVVPFTEANTTDFGGQEADMETGKIPLYLGGFLSIEGGVWDGSGLLPALELALDHVNARPDVLARYDLRLVWNDSQCMAGLGTRYLFEQLFLKPQKVMLVGPACSGDSQAVSQTAYYWNLLTLSYSAASSALSNREEYPYFFRTYVPDAMYNPIRIMLLKKFNWTRVATIHQNYEVFSLAIDNLRTLLKQANITILASESFGDSPKNQMENIKATDAHIIIGNMYEREGRKVFCEAYHQGMYGKNYMWFLLGWWSKAWWRIDDQDRENLTCTSEELITTVTSSMYIATEVDELDKSSKLTVAGFTAMEIQKMYKERLKLPRYSEARASGVDFFGYDAIWAIALMLNQSSAIMEAGGLTDGSRRNLEDFNYDDKEMAKLFFNVFQNLRFQGATGHVSFSNADRVGPTKLEQLQGSCEDGWYLHDIYCFRFVFNDTDTWTTARTSCKRFSDSSTGKSSMAAILSEEELVFLKETWQASNFKDDFAQWHIGLHRRDDDDTLRWVDITKDEATWLPDSFVTDHLSQNGKICFAFDFALDDGAWIPVDCSSEIKPYICKRRAYFDEAYITSITVSDNVEPNLETLRWPGGVIPIDHTPGATYIDVDEGIPLLLFLVVGSISSACILMTLFFLGFNIYFANQRFVKLSSPKLNNLILIGSLLIYASILTSGFHLRNIQQDFPAVCMIRTWMVSVGFVLAFGAMFSKTWRVHRVATFKTPKRRIVTDKQLFGIVGFLLLVDVTVLTLWQIIDPQRVETISLTEKPDPNVENQILRPYIRLCTSGHILIWSSGLYGYKGLLLIFGTFLAWETRKVRIPALNDSKLIGLSVYNVIILCAIGLGVSFALGDDPGSLFLFISCIMLFCTSATLIVIFVPKIVSVYKDPKGENAISSTTATQEQRTVTEVSVVAVQSITEENKTLRAKIMELQKTLQETPSSSAQEKMNNKGHSGGNIDSDGNEDPDADGCGIWLGSLSLGCSCGPNAKDKKEKYQVRVQSEVRENSSKVT